MVSRTKESAHDQLSVPALLAAAPAHPVDMLTDERPCRQHPDAAAVQLYGCATPLSGGVAQPQSSHILPTACSKPAGQSPSVVGSCGRLYRLCPEQVRKKKAGLEKTPPLPLTALRVGSEHRRDEREPEVTHRHAGGSHFLNGHLIAHA